MRINFHGRLEDAPEIRAGFIGCGSHSFRNIYPTFQFAPVHLVATCDLDAERARAFAHKFGATSAYGDHREMLEKEDLDAVFIVTGYDSGNRPPYPLYPQLAVECLNAGLHVWMEKPPASRCSEIEQMQQAAARAGKNVVVALKKMFFPANEKAAELMRREDFGGVSMAMLQYPQPVPEVEYLLNYLAGKGEMHGAVGFLDHICHPASLLVFLMGMPETLYYERAASGAAMANFSFANGTIATIALTAGQSLNGGMERTTIIGNGGHHIVVENNTTVSYHRHPNVGYGDNPNFYRGDTEDAIAVWDPEFSLGQLYNKGIAILGYYGEVNEFARSILEARPPAKGTLEQAWQVTRIFEAFAEGPQKLIRL